MREETGVTTVTVSQRATTLSGCKDKARERFAVINDELKVVDQNAAFFSTMINLLISFIVAHRLSTITGAGVILVMRNGHVIEQGTHSELLKKSGSIVASTISSSRNKFSKFDDKTDEKKLTILRR